MSALNFDSACAGLPLGVEFEALDEEEQHAVVFRLVERVVEQLEASGREPDDYEREAIGSAIQAMSVGIWSGIPASIHRACTPPEARLPVFGGGILKIPSDKTLRQMLNEVVS